MKMRETDPTKEAKGIIRLVGMIFVTQMILVALFCGGMIWLAVWLVSEYLL